MPCQALALIISKVLSISPGRVSGVHGPWLGLCHGSRVSAVLAGQGLNDSRRLSSSRSSSSSPWRWQLLPLCLELGGLLDGERTLPYDRVNKS